MNKQALYLNIIWKSHNFSWKKITKNELTYRYKKEGFGLFVLMIYVPVNNTSSDPSIQSPTLYHWAAALLYIKYCIKNHLSFNFPAEFWISVDHFCSWHFNLQT